jgi:hypothetical protein
MNLLMLQLFFQKIIKKILQKHELIKKTFTRFTYLEKCFKSLAKSMRRFFCKNIRKDVQYSFMSYKNVILMRLMINLLTIHAKRMIIQAKNIQL